MAISKDNRPRPGDPVQRNLFFSLKSRMLVSFGLIFTLVIVILGLVDTFGIPLTDYSGEYENQQAEVFRDLNLVADLKKERLLLWMKERKDDSTVLAESPAIRAAVTELRSLVEERKASGMSDKEFWGKVRQEETYKLLVEQMNLVRKHYGVYAKIEIASALSGTVIASTYDDDVGDNIFKKYPFMATRKSGNISITSFDEMEGAFHLHITKPIFSLKSNDHYKGDPTATMIVHIKTEDVFNPLLHTGKGLGKTGEALLVNEDVRLLVNLKHKLADGTTAIPLEYQIKAKPALLAAQGQEGITMTEDYRGKWVLAAYRHIIISPELVWGMVVKKDREEVFAPRFERLVIVTSMAAIGIVVMLVLVYMVSVKLSRPIQILSRTAEKVASGDFDVRAEVIGYNETRTLASTFNSMLSRIQGWHTELEKQVESRTVELKYQRDYLDKLYDSIGVPIFSVKMPGRIIVSVNSSVETVFGYKSEECIGQGIAMLYANEKSYLEFYNQITQCIIEGRDVLNSEQLLKRKNGEIFPSEITITFIKVNGEVIEEISIAKDITERMKAEEELVKYREHLEELVEERTVELSEVNKELEAFSYSVSHDLRAPLRGMDGFSRALLEDYEDKLDDEGKDYLRMLSSSANQMAELIDALLVLSRVTRREIKRERIDLRELALKIVEDIKNANPKHKVVFNVEDNLYTNGDTNLIKTMLHNLLENAFKYSEKRSPAKIEFGSKQEDGKEVFYIKDNGAGFDMKYSDKLFGAFQRLHSEAEFKGIGIGLATAQRIIKRHGGRIWAEGKVDEGATFYFTF